MQTNICFFNTPYNILKPENGELLIHYVVTGIITKNNTSKRFLKIVIWCLPSVSSSLAGFLSDLITAEWGIALWDWSGRIYTQMRTSPEGSKKLKEQTKPYHCFLQWNTVKWKQKSVPHMDKYLQTVAFFFSFFFFLLLLLLRNDERK